MSGALIFPVGYAPLSNGAVVPGGKLTFSRTGTSTAQNTYSDSTLATPNTNPVVLNSEGYLTTHVYGDPYAYRYRITLTTSADVQLWQRDDVLLAVPPRYEITAAETSAGVTPTNYQYPPGDVRRYGGLTSASAATNTTAIQAALDSNQWVTLPEQGTYSVSDTLKMNDNNVLVGMGLGTVLQWNVTSKSLIEGKTKATARQYRWGLRDLKLDNTARTNASAIGVDFSNLTDGEFRNVIAQNVETGWYGVSANGALQCRFYSCLASTVDTALTLGTLTNECKFFDFRVADTTDGVFINNNSGHKFYALQIEEFTGTAITVGNSATAQYVMIDGLRLENSSAGSSIGFTLHATQAQSTFLSSLSLVNVNTAFSASGLDTIILSGERNSPELRTNILALGQGALDNAQWAYIKATATADVSIRNATDSGYADLRASDIYAARYLRLAGAASGAADTVTLGNATQTTVGSAGGASALPATPTGYLLIYVGTTQYAVPYFAAS